jgi:hypothetical protein
MNLVASGDSVGGGGAGGAALLAVRAVANTAMTN